MTPDSETHLEKQPAQQKQLRLKSCSEHETNRLGITGDGLDPAVRRLRLSLLPQRR